MEQADLGDEALRQHIRALKPFVTSLSRIDEDGQELRYHTNRDDDQSLSDYSLANLEVIRDSLGDLSKVISAWKYRTIEFIEDRATNACTEKLSRRDLITIAKILPALARWKGPLFEEKKQQVQTRFNLSSREFCKAIDVIKNNREMKAIVGGETSLLYLPDHLVVWVVEQWRKLHPPRTGSDPGITVVTLDKRAAEAMKDHYCKRSEVVLALQVRLSDQQLAELEVIDSLGRNRWFPESYEDQVQRTQKRHALEGNASEQISHLIGKPNFLRALLEALPRLGRPSLAARLSGI